jgi:eukaryotic-like serine/threonine-protein kinase
MTDRTIGNYVLGPLLGRGGMSEVYAAEHRFLGDRVAIKLLRSHLADDPAAIAAFTAEATRTRAIAHPNVVRVIDFGSDGDDCYLVMERVEGETLSARLERERRLEEADVRRLGAAIADGVAAAHDRGIVHRDLKPGNVMLAGDVVKIVDFGIARMFGGGAASVTGSRIGSLAYMAPEQITEGLIAPCVDIWALGVILYEALSGRMPFADFANGRTPQLFEQAPPLSTVIAVSPALEALVAACLARAPARRPTGMRDVAAQLRDTTDPRFTVPLSPEIGRGSDSRGVPNATQPRRSARRRRWGIAALATMIALVAAWRIAARDAALPEPAVAATSSQPAADIAVERAESPPASRTREAASPEAASPEAASPEAASPEAASPSPVKSPSPVESPTAAASAARAAGFTVEIRSVPSGANVLVGGKRVGVTPTTIALDVPASIVVTRSGYRPSSIRAERAGPITLRLVRAHRARSAQPVAGETLD